MIANLAINNVYLPYLGKYTNRTEVYYGGAGSGKSVFVSQKLVVKALRGKRKILVIRKVARTQKESCFTVMKDTLSSLEILNKCTINKSTLDITLPNGSVFLFKGMDDNEKIKSIANITDIWIEEATELTLDDYTQLNLRLRAKAPNLQMLLSFNPISKANWCYQTFFTKTTDAFVLKTTYRENQFLPQAYIDSLEKMKETNFTYYRIYALGEFCSLDKLVFTNWEEKDFDVNELIAKKQYTTLIGLDFGFTNDPTALVVSLCDTKNKELYIFDEYGDAGLLNPDIANIIKSLGYSKNIIMADCAEQKSIEEIRRAGVPKIKKCAKGSDSVLFGIQQLQQYKIYIHPKCTGVKTEFQNYSWEKDRNTNEYVNKPVDKFNHYIDALRYSMQIIRGKMGTLPKGAL
ncbi:PBSX family phage terminase large subunit [Anaerotignum sp.]|uniref:PBSX family phage terminase large subunit n=1 Tax=Anaerotignum sp. TaxID=2039241 RepID=UPI00289F98D2|nr:PBSX family phage terminase large subunit [Anaerotignum sp.]